MNNLQTHNLLSQSNKLIESKYSLTITEQRLIFAMISMISPEDEDFREYRIKISDLAKILGLKNKNIYSEIKEITKNIIKKTIQIKKETGILQVNWISSAEYIDSAGVVILTFDPKLKPYLLQLKENFTSTKFGITVKFKTFYTTRIYQLLKQYEKIGKRSITLEFLYRIFDQYDSYKDLKKRIIEPAKKEINEKSDITFTYEEVKVGKKVYELKFIIRKQSYSEELPLSLPTVKVKSFDKYDEKTQDLAKKINEKYEVSLDLAGKIVSDVLKENSEEDFGKIFEYIDSILEGGKIRNSSGFVVSCIREKYYNSISYSRKKEMKKEFSEFLFKEAKRIFLELPEDQKKSHIEKLRESDSYFRSRYDSLGFSSRDILHHLIIAIRDELIGKERMERLEKDYSNNITK